MVYAALGIAAKAGTVRIVEITDRVVDFPARGRKVGFDGCDCAAIEAMGAVIDDGVFDDVKVVATFGGNVSSALTGSAHHAVSVSCRNKDEEEEEKKKGGEEESSFGV